MAATANWLVDKFGPDLADVVEDSAQATAAALHLRFGRGVLGGNVDQLDDGRIGLDAACKELPDVSIPLTELGGRCRLTVGGPVKSNRSTACYFPSRLPSFFWERITTRTVVLIVAWGNRFSR